FQVSLALYDLSNGMALQMSRQFALLEGRTIEMIPHTGVRLHGKEYFFGGGVQALPPATVERTFGRKPVRIERLGTTDRTAADIATWLRDTARQWSPESYDLWRHNCNDFSQALTRFLLGARATIPAWILTLPAEVLATPLGKLLEPGLGAFQ
ncbi:PPPDE putative peptidase domain-containing protein, partial [Pelagophyceae sp. CCMP2097]